MYYMSVYFCLFWFLCDLCNQRSAKHVALSLYCPLVLPAGCSAMCYFSLTDDARVAIGNLDCLPSAICSLNAALQRWIEGTMMCCANGRWYDSVFSQL